MQNQPTLSEMLEAVRELLTDELMPTIQDSGLKFKALIAANLLSIGERELKSGEAEMDAELAGLRRLLSADSESTPVTQHGKRQTILDLNRQLVARIRAGEADSGAFRDEVSAHVRETLIQQLKISNPKFLQKFSQR